jgi:hypothetical protein
LGLLIRSFVQRAIARDLNIDRGKVKRIIEQVT